MGERVETGGLMSFNYSKAEKSKLSKKDKAEFEKAYEKYYERKKREKRRKFFIVLLIIILLIAGLIFFISRF